MLNRAFYETELEDNEIKLIQNEHFIAQFLIHEGIYQSCLAAHECSTIQLQLTYQY